MQISTFSHCEIFRGYMSSNWKVCYSMLHYTSKDYWPKLWLASTKENPLPIINSKVDVAHDVDMHSFDNRCFHYWRVFFATKKLTVKWYYNSNKTKWDPLTLTQMLHIWHSYLLKCSHSLYCSERSVHFLSLAQYLYADAMT